MIFHFYIVSTQFNLFHFIEGLYSQKIKTLKNFKIKSKENKISHGRGNSLRNFHCTFPHFHCILIFFSLAMAFKVWIEHCKLMRL